jgi:hypothetical protein
LGGKVGALEPGQFADLVVLTRASFHYAPLNNVVHQLVYCENGMSVTDVMVNGRWVVRGGEVRTINERALYRRAQALRDEMDERLKKQFEQTAALEPALREAYFRSAGTAWTPAKGVSVESAETPDQ